MANKSVYNFVPAPKENEVFKPKWAKYVSQDIPFEDAQSGEIEIELEALTPIFIRNGQKKEANDNSFSHYIDNNGKKQYFIPGTSLKGMVRNVLEILSYSKLNKKLVNDHRYSYRDLTPKSLFLRKYDTNKVYCGWLKQDDERNWKILECGKPIKIKHKEINELLQNKVDYWQLFEYEKNKKNQYRYAKDKYKLITDKGFETNPKVRYNEKDYNLVFTGQVSLVDYSSRRSFSKKNEFLFPIVKQTNEITILEKMQNDFRFIYKERATDESPDWKFWREKLEKGKMIPVFYNKDEKTNKILHFGLAFMYKLPYEKSVHEVFPIKNYSEEFDLAETMFGYTKEGSLKGRISFGHAKNINDSKPIEVDKIVLGSPKASFFPYYLNQDMNKDGEVSVYKTFEDNKASLRGFKRYPVRGSIMKSNAEDSKNTKVQTSLNPLEIGALFRGKVRFFNLKREELGALLSALTFHDKENCYHNLGMAKPFGYGKVALKVKHIKVDDKKVETKDYISSFETLMETKISNWKNSKPLQELFSMASNSNDDILGYMELESFRDVKKYKEQLDYFTQIISNNPSRNISKEKEYEAYKPSKQAKAYQKGDEVDVKIINLNDQYLILEDEQKSIFTKPIKNVNDKFEKVLEKKRKKKPNIELLPLQVNMNLKIRFNADLDNDNQNFTVLPPFK